MRDSGRATKCSLLVVITASIISHEVRQLFRRLVFNRAPISRATLAFLLAIGLFTLITANISVGFAFASFNKDATTERYSSVNC
jgi:hypothetical protein